MRKCIVISDSFKGTLSSREICDIARQTIPKFFPCCKVITVLVADGGEGTVDCLIEAIGAKPVEVSVSGPYREDITAVYARKEKLAVIEMASAAGLPMVKDRMNPGQTTTYGVGELIRHGVEHLALSAGGNRRRSDAAGEHDDPADSGSLSADGGSFLFRDFPAGQREN